MESRFVSQQASALNSSPIYSNKIWGSPTFHIQGEQETFTRLLRCAADNSLLHNAEVMNIGSHPPLPQVCVISGSQSSVVNGSGLLGCDAISLCEWLLIFESKMVHSSSRVNHRLWNTWRVKMNTLYFFETPGTTHPMTVSHPRNQY